MSPFFSSVRSKIWALLLLVIVTGAARVQYQNFEHKWSARHDPQNALMTTFGKRLVPVRKVLGHERSMGYVPRLPHSIQQSAWFYAACYHLAPTVLDPGKPQTHPYVLANFADDRSLKQYLNQHPLKMRMHFSPGLAILQRVEP